MATNTVTVTSFKTAIAEAADAIDAGDFTTAELKILKAATLLSGLELEKGSQNSIAKWRQDLSALREMLDKIRSQNNAKSERRWLRGRTNFVGGNRRGIRDSGGRQSGQI